MGKISKCNQILRKLQIITNGQPIGENFKILKRTFEYAQNNKLIL